MTPDVLCLTPKHRRSTTPSQILPAASWLSAASWLLSEGLWNGKWATLFCQRVPQSRRIQFTHPVSLPPTSYPSTVFCKLVVKGLAHESFLGPQPCSGSFPSAGPCPAGMSHSLLRSQVLVLGAVVIPLWALRPRVPSGCEDLPSLFLF